MVFIVHSHDKLQRKMLTLSYFKSRSFLEGGTCSCFSEYPGSSETHCGGKNGLELRDPP